MNKILICYRRKDSADVTGRIYDRLRQEFGPETVFKDVDSIHLGVDFRIYLDEQVACCDVFLAVIGRDWIRKQGTKAKSRLDDPEDFVRIEIESALKRHIPVIPVLVRGASIPSASKLPISIQELTYRNGIPVRPDPDFHRDMDRLIGDVKRHVQGYDKHRPEADAIAQNAFREEKRFSPLGNHANQANWPWKSITGFLLFLFCLIGTAVWLWPKNDTDILSSMSMMVALGVVWNVLSILVPIVSVGLIVWLIKRSRAQTFRQDELGRILNEIIKNNGNIPP